MAGSSTEVAVDYHPEVPRPPFMWTVELPPTFSVLDIHPQTWRGRIDRSVDALVPGYRMSAAQKRQAGLILTETVLAAQKAQAVAVLLKGGVIDGPLIAATSLVFRWADASPRLASLGAVKKAFSGQHVEERSTPGGMGWVLVESVEQAGPVTDRRAVFVYQGFLPIPGTSWMLIVTASAPSEDTKDSVKDILIRVVGSVGIFGDSAGYTVDELASTFGQDSATVVIPDGQEQG
ncbi:hypothetical protein [Corynebacterium cystitidis]|uniref:hypothetical protein n=1 Tax=Corynebacterium cystitidis TaxID=35757 RepID=UPI00211F0C08|nr:hypothetical protein [Corynebacterium cystitidis]